MIRAPRSRFRNAGHILAALPPDEVATILGRAFWKVTVTARRYVTGEAMSMGMIAPLQGAENKGQLPPLPRGQKRSNRHTRVAGELGLDLE